jgi:putative tryptophan/tyrosine transport system substrate-binding protein
MKRREFIAGLGAAAWSFAVRAQQAERVRRIGVLAPSRNNVPIFQAAFREELAKLGWVEGRNVRIDYRISSADPGHLAADAQELVNLHPNVIYAIAGVAALGAQRRTQIIPIVFAGGGDPIQNNVVGGIARPAGNVTGFGNNFLATADEVIQ